MQLGKTTRPFSLLKTSTPSNLLASFPHAIDYFRTEKVNPKKVARKAAETALKMLTAAECPSGKMPVVIGNGWGGHLP